MIFTNQRKEISAVFQHPCYHCIKYARNRFINTRMHNCIQLYFTVCKPPCFSVSSDPQSSVQQQLRHVDWATERAQTDDSSLTDDGSRNDSWQQGGQSSRLSVVTGRMSQMYAYCITCFFFLRPAAVLTKCKKKKYVIWSSQLSNDQSV